jgi:transmembrane anterior posterior transformation protein 1
LHGHRGKELRRVHVYDVLRCLVILGSYYFLSEVQLSRVYHYIRGEAIIKLYVLFNILEVDAVCTLSS